MKKFLTRAEVALLKEKKVREHKKVFNPLAVALEKKRVALSGGITCTQSNKKVREATRMSLYTVGGVKVLHKGGADRLEQQRRYAQS